MREQTTDLAIAYAIALLSHYKFELRGYKAEELVNLWLRNYPANWVRLGVIEALYLGRYKAVSVEQILAVWGRRGQPIYRFTHEFERLISRKLPQNLTTPLNASSTQVNQEVNLPQVNPASSELINELISVKEEASTSLLEENAQEDASTVQQDTLPPATTSLEDLTEIPVESDAPVLQFMRNVGATPSYNADWSRCEVSKQPIDQFTPPPDASGFYLKLKAVLQQQDLPPANVVTSVMDEGESHPIVT